MQNGLSLLTTIVLATLTVASPTRRTIPASQCDTGPIQCCQDLKSITSIPGLLTALGVFTQNPAVLVGLTCNPITVTGSGSDSCTAQPVCCENNNFQGIISIGCTPVDLSL